jgi:hypothetical protein
LREICPLKKMTPKSCPINGTVTGKLLRLILFVQYPHKKQIRHIILYYL